MGIDKELRTAIEKPTSDALSKLLDERSDKSINSQKNVLAVYIILDYGHEPVYEKLKEFVERGFNINQKKDTNAYSLLHKAVSLNNSKVVDFLLKEGAKVNEHNNKYGRLPLHFSDSPEITESLIQNKSELDLKDKEGNTPLNVFAGIPSSLDDDPKIAKQIKLLLDAGANQLTFNKDGTTPLIGAISFPLKKCIDVLLEYEPEVNYHSGNGDTPLHFAVRKELLAVTKKLIKLNADVNMANPSDGWTPLFHAAFRGHTKIIEILLDAGATKNKTDINGKKPIDFAKNKKVKRLLQ